VEAVIKIGGSLAEETIQFRKLCKKINELSKKHEILIVPGGGKFADSVREFDRKFSLSNKISHQMAILAMDQFGMLLSDLIPESHVSYSLETATNTASSQTTSILLPSHLMFKAESLEKSWDVTSDTIAAYVAKEVKAEKLIIATDVDGVFTSNPKKDANAKFIQKISAEKLLNFGQETSLDRYFAKFFLKSNISCFVVNGKYPDRIEAIMSGKKTTFTIIFSEKAM
jgi:aspartokinase-like uncharacterized kinase